MKRRIWIIAAVCLAVLAGAGMVVLSVVPRYDYILPALRYRIPKIDHYPLFGRAVVLAGDPQPWPYAPGVATARIPDSVEAAFAGYETTAYLVVKDGEIVLEQYWDGYADTLWSNSFSMAKSVVSLLVGCAIDDGYIQSVEQPVADFLPGDWAWRSEPLRIRDLLTMSAGFQWDESAASLFSPTTQIYYGGDLAAILYRTRFKERPGVHFEYQSGVTQLLAMVLTSAVGRPLSDYASEKLWRPLGAEEDAIWSTDDKGVEKAFCCFNSNARDFARIGQLILQHGRWNGVPLVDSAYVRTAVTPADYLRFGDQACTFYGYQFWVADLRGHTMPYCRGILGQYIIVVPDENMVVVRLGRSRSEERDAAQDYTLDLELWVNTALDMFGSSSNQ